MPGAETPVIWRFVSKRVHPDEAAFTNGTRLGVPPPACRSAAGAGCHHPEARHDISHQPSLVSGSVGLLSGTAGNYVRLATIDLVLSLGRVYLGGVLKQAFGDRSPVAPIIQIASTTSFTVAYGRNISGWRQPVCM